LYALGIYIAVAYIISVRHGYMDLTCESRASTHHNCCLQNFYTPPLRSRGVQKIMYVTKDNFSYSHFPSSDSTTINTDMVPRVTTQGENASCKRPKVMFLMLLFIFGSQLSFGDPLSNNSKQLHSTETHNCALLVFQQYYCIVVNLVSEIYNLIVKRIHLC
jgi:hypothetical protein